MDRRDFLQTSAIGLAGAAAVSRGLLAEQGWRSPLLRPDIDDGVPRTQDVRLQPRKDDYRGADQSICQQAAGAAGAVDLPTSCWCCGGS